MIEWPTSLIPSNMEWGRDFGSHAFESSLTRSTQIVIHPGAHWVCSLSFRNLGRDKERVLSTFLGKLQGRGHPFRLRPWTRPPGPDRGNAVVDGANNAAATLASRNWNANVLVLRAGDYITVADQLLEVLDDVQSNSTGHAVIPVSPWLRQSPANGATIHYREPYGIMRLTSDSERRSVQALVAGATLECREDF